MMPNRFPLGTVIAERRIALFEQTGDERWITVRLGSPVGVHLGDGSPLRSEDPEEGTFRCPVQILGLDHDEGIRAIRRGSIRCFAVRHRSYRRPAPEGL
jgi:hypothetical protein